MRPHADPISPAKHTKPRNKKKNKKKKTNLNPKPISRNGRVAKERAVKKGIRCWAAGAVEGLRIQDEAVSGLGKGS